MGHIDRFYHWVLSRINAKSIILVFLFFTVFTTGNSWAVEYYVNSNAGNDANNGRSPSTVGNGQGPWKTIARVNRTLLQPGDKVLFACGGVWQETLRIRASGIEGRPISVGSYPSSCSDKPLITGAMLVSGWSTVNQYITSTKALAVEPHTVRSTTEIFRPASFPRRGHNPNNPNSNYLTTAGNSPVINNNGLMQSPYLLTGQDLRLPFGVTSLAGAKIRFRSNAWIIEEGLVSSHEGNRLVLLKPSRFPIESGWGYYLMGKLWMLDEPGEWFYDNATKTLYVWPSAGIRNRSMIYASSLNEGVNVENQRYVNIEGLSISFVSIGINIRNSQNVNIKSNTISDVAHLGIAALNSLGAVIDSNTITNSDVDGISTESTESGAITVANNSLKNIGVRIENEKILSLPQRSFAAIFTGNNASVTGNTIENSGYIGIGTNTNSRVGYNVIQGACSVLDDCGGIYTGWNSVDKIVPTNTAIFNNFVYNSRGNTDGKPPGIGTQAQGIYADDFSTNVSILYNTVAMTDHGIQLHNSSRNRVLGNKLYFNRKSQLWLQSNAKVTRSTGDIYDNWISNNAFVPANGALGFLSENEYGSTEGFATFAFNRYYDLINPVIAIESDPKKWRSYSFQEWTNAFTASGVPRNQDVRSIALSQRGYPTYVPSGTDLIVNGAMTNGIVGWQSWNQQAPFGTLGSLPCQLGTCLRYVAGASVGLVSTPNFSIVKDKWYLVSFDHKTGRDGQLFNVVLRRGGGKNNNGYETLADRIVGVVGARNFGRKEFIVKATATVNKDDPITGDYGARVDFYDIAPGDELYLTNVKVVPITAPDNVLRVDLLANPGTSQKTFQCPASSTAPQMCQNYYLFRTEEKISWPYTLAPQTAEVVFTRP